MRPRPPLILQGEDSCSRSLSSVHRDLETRHRHGRLPASAPARPQARDSVLQPVADAVLAAAQPDSLNRDRNQRGFLFAGSEYQI